MDTALQRDLERVQKSRREKKEALQHARFRPELHNLLTVIKIDDHRIQYILRKIKEEND